MKLTDNQLEKEEEIILEVIVSARNIQEFLWGKTNTNAGIEEFRRMLRKRLAKIDSLDTTNHYYKVELRKRLLQLSAICINFIRQLEERDIPEKGDIVSNLPQFGSKVKDK